MQHSIPEVGDPDVLQHLTAKFEDFVLRQTGEVRATLLAFLHLVEADATVCAELGIARNGDIHLKVVARRNQSTER